jgi:hypothetical protein
MPGIRFLALAETEIDDAADWYAVQDDGDQLSNDFSRSWTGSTSSNRKRSWSSP